MRVALSTLLLKSSLSQNSTSQVGNLHAVLLWTFRIGKLARTASRTHQVVRGMSGRRLIPPKFHARPTTLPPMVVFDQLQGQARPSTTAPLQQD
jgi:hypothetical protein